VTAPTQPYAQRWREGSPCARPLGEVADVSRLSVVPLGRDADARAFVEAHHYSGSYPAARRRFGLLQDGLLSGVAVFSQPMHDGVFRDFTAPAPECLELGRFVLLDQIAANAETWFLARCFKALRLEGFAGVVAMSDPQPRANAAGAVVFRGHYGCIYQASNAHYLGRATARALHLLPDGSVFSARAASKIRAKDQGWRYAVGQLVEAGAQAPAPYADLRAWLAVALAEVARKVRHPGNHRYGWALNKRAWRSDVQRLAYPKGIEQ
jgi:hypothetical protein